MISKTILLVISFNGYQPMEYGHTREELEKAGFKVVVASTEQGTAHSHPHIDKEYGQVHVDVALSQVDVTKYAGLFLVGGHGALRDLDNQTVYDLITGMHALKRSIGAICISPRILAKAGILTNKSATGWNDDKLLDGVFKKYGVVHVQKPVVTDGKIVTADGPFAAREFGKAIVALSQLCKL